MPHQKYKCKACDKDTVRWFIQCPGCGAFDALVGTQTATREERFEKEYAAGVISLDSVPGSRVNTFETGLIAFDAALGDGIVQGAVTLLAGAPGTGKSRLALQCSANISRYVPSIYISGEESPSRLVDRARDLNLNVSTLPVCVYTETHSINRVLRAERPKFLVIDSLQTLYSKNLPQRVGSIAQITNAVISIVKITRELNIATLLICHVTKDDLVSGPRFVEHAVDVMMYFEAGQEGTDSARRTLRATKNRFGPAHIEHYLKMVNTGLIDYP